MRTLAAQVEAICRRPLSLNAQFHRELCRCCVSTLRSSTCSCDCLLGSKNLTKSLWFLNLLSLFAQSTSLTLLLCRHLVMKCSCNHLPAYQQVRLISFLFLNCSSHSNSRFSQPPQHHPCTCNSWFQPTDAEGLFLFRIIKKV